MAKVQSRLECNHDYYTNANRQETTISRINEFVQTFLTNEIWHSNELSAAKEEIIKRIKSGRDRIWTENVDKRPPIQRNEHTCYDGDNNNIPEVSKKEMFIPTADSKESTEFMGWCDPLLLTVLPPYEHLKDATNVISNALFEDGKQEGSVWRDTVVRYNNPFDPRLKFDGLLTDKLKQIYTENPDIYHSDTYNCYLNILNPSGFTNSYLNDYEENIKRYRQEKSIGKLNTRSGGYFADNSSDIPGDKFNKSSVEFSNIMDGCSELMDMKSMMERIQVFWTREDYKWLDLLKDPKSTLVIPSERQMESAQSNEPDMYQYTSNSMPTQTYEPCDSVPYWCNTPSNDEINVQNYQSSVNGQNSRFHQQRVYPGQQPHYIMNPNKSERGYGNPRIQTYSQTFVSGNHGEYSTLPSQTWSNDEVGDYTALKIRNKETVIYHRKPTGIHQLPLECFPVVPELTTSMFWSHQKREYLNKHNATTKHVNQSTPADNVVNSKDTAPASYEHNINPEGKVYTQSLEYPPLGGNEQRTVEENIHDANGYHFTTRNENVNQVLSCNNDKDCGIWQEEPTNGKTNTQKSSGNVIGGEVDQLAQEKQLVNVNEYSGMRQDLKFDDEVWYINGVPHQHAKPFCPQNTNLQYVVDVPPPSWSPNQGWSPGPTPDVHTQFNFSNPSNECHRNQQLTMGYNNSAFPSSSIYTLNPVDNCPFATSEFQADRIPNDEYVQLSVQSSAYKPQECRSSGYNSLDGDITPTYNTNCHNGSRESKKPNQANSNPGKNIKVVSGVRPVKNVRPKKQKSQRSSVTKSCLIKLV